MDFELTEDQTTIRDLAARILAEQLPAERLREMEERGEWPATDVWTQLAGSGLLGIGLPEGQGGGGLGLLEACLVAEQVGRAVAPLPYLPAVIGAGRTIARFGTPAQQDALLPGLIEGRHLLSVALHEANEVRVPAHPRTQAVAADDGWRLEGEKSVVVAADTARALLVPARTSDAGTTVFLVDPTASGVELSAQRAVTGEPRFTVGLRDVAVGPDDVIGEVDGGGQVVTTLVDDLMAGICATQTGVCEGALAITAAYVTTREQFGAKLGTFQAVGHRVADAYIDTEAIRLTALQAIWRLDAGLDAADELLTAKFWAAEGAQRVVHAAQHLHGGIGVDLDYPIHRYFRWAKVLELDLGGASPSLLQLGANLATRGRTT